VVGPGDPIADVQLIKELETALAAATQQFQRDPNSEIWRLATQDAQTRLDQARPPKLKTTQLQLSRELHTRENEVARLKEAIKRKSDQYASIELQLVAHCEELEGKELEVVEVRARVAEAVVFTPPQAPTLATQAPAIRESVLQRYAAAANDADVSDKTKAEVADFLADQTRLDVLFQTLFNIDRAISTDREIAASNRVVIADVVDGALARTPEKTTSATTAPTDTAPQFAATPPPPVLPLQSTRCPLRAPVVIAPVADDAMVGPTGQAKRSAEDARAEDQATSVNRWMEFSRRGRAEGPSKKTKEGASPTQMDEDTADAEAANKK